MSSSKFSYMIWFFLSHNLVDHFKLLKVSNYNLCHCNCVHTWFSFPRKPSQKGPNWFDGGKKSYMACYLHWHNDYWQWQLLIFAHVGGCPWHIFTCCQFHFYKSITQTHHNKCRNPTLAKCGVKLNTWKKWGFGVLRNSRMFRAWQQGPKHLALRCSWCHWKGLEA